MPVIPQGSETEDEFIGRCMGEEKSSFPDNTQRYAVCKSKWDTQNMSVDLEEENEIDALPEPNKGEEREKYIMRCIPEIYPGGGEYDQRTAIAMCSSKYENSGVQLIDETISIDNPKAGETEEHYLGYCLGEHIKAGHDIKDGVSMCYSMYRKGMGMSGERLVASKLNQLSKYKGIYLAEGGLEDACWEGYEPIGTKILDGREVPNCVPIKE